MADEMTPASSGEVSGDINDRFEAWLNASDDEPQEDIAEEAVEGEVEQLAEDGSNDPSINEDNQEEQSEEDSGTVKLVIGGKEVDVPNEIASVVEEMRVSLEADHTRKTQEAAEIRKQAQVMQQQLVQETEFYRQNIEVAADLRALQKRLAEYDNVDWGALAEQDLVLYTRHKEKRDGMREELHALERDISARVEAVKQHQSQKLTQDIAATAEIVQRAIPDYMQKYDSRVVSAAEELAAKYGMKIDRAKLTEMACDPVVVLGLVELVKYQDLLKSKPNVTKKVANTPVAQFNGNKSVKKQSQQNDSKMRSLLKAGRLREAAELS